MKSDQNINDALLIFASAMLAIAIKVLRATERPSKTVFFGEVLIGVSFCWVIAPALQEYYGLSTKVTCALAWVSSYFSGLILKAAEEVLKESLKSFAEVIRAYFAAFLSRAKSKRKGGDES
jgi:hypothetical protein